MKLDNAHWLGLRGGHKQRMTTAQWREILLAHEERITVRGHVRTLVATSLGHGVVEVGVSVFCGQDHPHVFVNVVLVHNERVARQVIGWIVRTGVRIPHTGGRTCAGSAR